MIFDLSWPLDTTTTSYKNNKPLTITQLKDFERDGVRDSNITLNSHAGTHIDAPAHFLKNGSTCDQIPLNTLIGKCTVLDLTNVTSHITANDLLPYQHSLTQGARILLKTNNSSSVYNDPFNFEFIYLAKDAAQLLANAHIALVGIDYLGIERAQPNHETHSILMENNIVIVEGLRLAALTAGNYHLICLPLATKNLEAAPARVIATPLT